MKKILFIACLVLVYQTVDAQCRSGRGFNNYRRNNGCGNWGGGWGGPVMPMVLNYGVNGSFMNDPWGGWGGTTVIVPSPFYGNGFNQPWGPRGRFNNGYRGSYRRNMYRGGGYYNRSGYYAPRSRYSRRGYW